MARNDNISKQLLSSQVEDALLDYVIKECEIGQRLPNEFQLAERFGTGRSTIREAVKSLKSQGILEVRQGSGTYVVSKSPDDNDPLHLSSRKDRYKLALELLDVRLLVEPGTAEMAAKNCTEEQAKRLTELCDTVEDLYNRDIDHTQVDVKFHEYIAEISDNSILISLIPLIQTSVLTFANMTYRALKEETITSHRALTNAICNHDLVGAKSAMSAHLYFNRVMILKLKEEHEREKKMRKAADNTDIHG